MYSELLSIDEMESVAKSTGMISGTAGPLSTEGMMKVKAGVLAIYTGILAPIFTTLNNAALSQAAKLEQHWFVRLSKKLIR